MEEGLLAAVCLGASGVKMGTAFLRCTEIGALSAHDRSNPSG
ncbi:nitronate monooxygenase [Pradoshia sp.]